VELPVIGKQLRNMNLLVIMRYRRLSPENLKEAGYVPDAWETRSVSFGKETSLAGQLGSWIG